MGTRNVNRKAKTEGKCVWCDHWVTDQRESSGADFRDLAHDGDFGCDMSPETDDTGVGSHALVDDPWLRRAAYFRAQMYDLMRTTLPTVQRDEGDAHVRVPVEWINELLRRDT